MALLRELEGRGVEVRTIFYEDFTYKKFHFLSAILAALRLPPLTAMPVAKLQKVSSAFPSEMFVNRAVRIRKSAPDRGRPGMGEAAFHRWVSTGAVMS